MLTLIAALAVGAGPITVENKMPCVVVNKMPARVEPATKTVTSYRPPVGHTHTCTSCGTTWDHKANETHKCLNCGGSPPAIEFRDRKGNVISVRYLTDASARPVTVTGTTVESSSVVESPPVMRSVRVPVRLPQANCPNGNCPYAR